MQSREHGVRDHVRVEAGGGIPPHLRDGLVRDDEVPGTSEQRDAGARLPQAPRRRRDVDRAKVSGTRHVHAQTGSLVTPRLQQADRLRLVGALVAVARPRELRERLVPDPPGQVRHLDQLRDVVDEREEHHQRGQREQDRERDAERWHEGVGLAAHRSQDDERVGEHADEGACGELGDAIGQEAAEDPRAVLGRRELQHDDREGEREAGDRHEGAGDGGQHVAGRRGSAAEADVGVTERVVELDRGERSSDEPCDDQPREEPEAAPQVTPLPPQALHARVLAPSPERTPSQGECGRAVRGGRARFALGRGDERPHGEG